MKTISASEIKRRGIIAAEELLSDGPVHVIKNNHLRCVILSEEDYNTLKQMSHKQKPLGLELLLNKPSTGDSTVNQINKRIAKSKSQWD